MQTPKTVIESTGGPVESVFMISWETYLYMVGTFSGTFTAGNITLSTSTENVTTSMLLLAYDTRAIPTFYRSSFYMVSWNAETGENTNVKSLNYDPNSQQVLVAGDVGPDIFVGSYDSWTGTNKFMRRIRYATARSFVVNRDNTYLLGVYKAPLFKNCTSDFINSTFVARYVSQ